MKLFKINEKSQNLQAAFECIFDLLSNNKIFYDNFSICVPFIADDILSNFLNIEGVEKFLYENKEEEFLSFGVGVEKVLTDEKFSQKSFDSYEKIRTQLFDDQYLFFSLVFDDKRERAKEWQHFHAYKIIIPSVSVVKIKDQCSLFVTFFDKGKNYYPFWQDKIKTICQIFFQKNIMQNFDPKYELLAVSSDFDQFKNILLAAKKMFSYENGEKIVLARRKTFKLLNNFNKSSLVRKLLGNKNTNNFYFEPDCGHIFLGASPEILFKIKDNKFYTESLAGTRSLSKNDNIELAIKSLNSCQKNIAEHKVVSDFIESRLKILGLYVESKEDGIKILSHVIHFKKRFTCRYSSKISLYDLIKTFHPTPAICAQNIAWGKKYLRVIENFDRGNYGGLIGVIGKNFCELTVAIRSCLINENLMYIYAGVGIIKESDLDDEWHELNTKEKTMLRLLEDDS